MSASDEFEAVRNDPDPVRRGRRATELLTLYQQRATELSRLRRAAIDEAHNERDMTYTEIAAAMGVSKGRITQIRGNAPTPERAFFGVGPVAIGVPWRYQTTDRERPLIAAEDAQTGEQLDRLLADLGFATTRFQVGPETEALPDGDAVIICGPKSSPIAETLLADDPALEFVETDGRWYLKQADGNGLHRSPSDEEPSEDADLAYVARHRIGSRIVVHVAGVHAIGSLGALHYLAKNLGALFAEVGNASFSCVIRAGFAGLEITSSELVAGPFRW